MTTAQPLSQGEGKEAPDGRLSGDGKAVRTVGIDLALTGPHVVVVANEHFEKILGPFKVEDTLDGLSAMWERCRMGLPARARVAFVMEPTGHAWLRMVAFLHSRGEKLVFVPSLRKFSVLRKTLSLGVKNDRLDAVTLSKLPAIANDKLRLQPVVVPEPKLMALKRLMKMDERVQREVMKAKTRLHALMGLYNRGALELLVNEGLFTEAARAFIKNVPTPTLVDSKQTLAQLLKTPKSRKSLDDDELGALFELCQTNAALVSELEEKGTLPIDVESVALEATNLLGELEAAEARRKPLTARRDELLAQLDPDGVLCSVPGIGPQLSAVILAYTGAVERFGSARDYKGYIGLVPGSSQTGGNKPAHGHQITKAGPNPLKRAYYLAANLAVLRDVQMAEFACRLQDRGLKYNQIMVAVANKLIVRVYSLLKRARLNEGVGAPTSMDAHYELRDTKGAPITQAEARETIAQGYRLKSAKLKQPKRERNAKPPPSGSEGVAAGEAAADGEEKKTPPVQTRQSLAPQPEAVLSDSINDIVERSACPAKLKRWLLSELAELGETADLESLSSYLRQERVEPEVVTAQVALLKRRRQVAGRPGA